MPSTFPCTASFPEHCHAWPVIAQSRPKEDELELISLSGLLGPAVELACVGPRERLQCPIPFDGREYGVSGELRVNELGGGLRRLLMDVHRLYRFTSEVSP